MAENEFVFIITHSHDAPERAAGALQLATNLIAFDGNVDFFLMNEGVHIARKGYAETITWQKGFSPLHELIATLTEEMGAKFYVCASCVEPYGLVGKELIDGAEVKPGSYLGELMMERKVATF